jgi:hypothetical protein
MPRALIIGGTGVIGRRRRPPASGRRPPASGRRLAGRPDRARLWRLPADIAAAGGRFVPAERKDAGQLAAAFGDGADLLVDACAAGCRAASRPGAVTVTVDSTGLAPGGHAAALCVTSSEMADMVAVIR